MVEGAKNRLHLFKKIIIINNLIVKGGGILVMDISVKNSRMCNLIYKTLDTICIQLYLG